MPKFAVLFAFSAVLFLGACATPRADHAGATPGATAAPTAPRLATPVNVPAASARKVVLTMTGPRQVTEAKDWADFKREWRETFAEHAKEADIAFSFVEGDMPPPGQDGTVLFVNVADYRMIGIGTRIMFGIMTGNAFIDARIRFANLRDGSTLGEQQYNTSSSAASGIFAKVTPQQVDAIAAEVFRDLRSAR